MSELSILEKQESDWELRLQHQYPQVFQKAKEIVAGLNGKDITSDELLELEQTYQIYRNFFKVQMQRAGYVEELTGGVGKFKSYVYKLSEEEKNRRHVTVLEEKIQKLERQVKIMDSINQEKMEIIEKLHRQIRKLEA